MAHTLHLQVELDAAGDTIRGSASDGGDDACAFEGWLELIALIERFQNRYQGERQAAGPDLQRDTDGQDRKLI